MTTPTLHALALAAAKEYPGEWTVESRRRETRKYSSIIGSDGCIVPTARVADFQAAASPSVVAALCERVAELESYEREFVSAAQLLNHRRVPLQVAGRQISLIDRIEIMRKEQAARIAALEAGLVEACEINRRMFDKYATIHDAPDAARSVALRELAEGKT